MPHYRPGLTAVAGAIVSGASPLFAAGPSLPSTEARPVTDEYHHVTVSDPYRWLEDSSGTRVEAWVKEENAVTRAHLDRVSHYRLAGVGRGAPSAAPTAICALSTPLALAERVPGRSM
jgi:hypothetical protein